MNFIKKIIGNKTRSNCNICGKKFKYKNLQWNYFIEETVCENCDNDANAIAMERLKQSSKNNSTNPWKISY